MTPKQDLGSAVLTILDHQGRPVRRVEVRGQRLLVGRDASTGLRLASPHVSRMHAVVRRDREGLLVEDLESASGTFVNDQRVIERRRVLPGDIITFADVRVRVLEDGTVGSPADSRRGLDAVQTPPTYPDRTDVHFKMRDQRAGTISNVGRDQYNITRERQSLLREVAATKTRARWLTWTGVLMLLTGLGIGFVAISGSLTAISDAISSNATTPPRIDVFGRKVLGVPLALLGMGLEMAGIVTTLIGIVLHVTAVSRRRQVERDYSIVNR
jgi:pSer/pThr/pTyr-binding forkhead associated (FHA) protein